MAPFVRMDHNREHGGLALLNAALDPVQKATLHIRAKTPEKVILLSEADEVSPAVRKEEDGWSIAIEEVPAWSIVLVLF